MEALLLAAGLGTRLKPLTDDKPKALVEIAGQTLLERNINRLISFGIKHITINIHHFADKIEAFVLNRQWDAEIVFSDERDMLLDTGGAIKHAAPLFSESDNILVHNVDILSDIDFRTLEQVHKTNNNLATLAVSERITDRQLTVDSTNRLRGWVNLRSGETIGTPPDTPGVRLLAFSGIAIIQRRFADLLPEASHPYPIIPEYLRIADKKQIGIYEHRASDWLDVGKPESLAKAEAFLNEHTL
ncbi:MAG: nucleotidyltransferase family protein [Bacteroidales bacterium]|nr:nucleotidyltransferase family protein [Bacteroidales bacterium]